MPRTPPAVSIGLPVYNGAALLPKAIESLLAQDFGDYEVIVSDNASDDETPEIVKAYAAEDPRISYVRNPSNIGLVANFNRVVELSRGPLFKWATHDDWCDPTFLGSCVEVLRTQPDAVVGCSAVAIHDERGALLETWRPDVDFAADSAVVRAQHMVWYSGETHPMFGVIRREALVRTSLMQSFLGASRVMLTELSLLGRIVVLPDPLYHYTYYRPIGRTYSVHNDPTNVGKLPLRTWRLGREHFMTVLRADLRPADKARLEGHVVARFGVHDARRLAAELYHSGRIIAARTRRAVTHA